MRAVRTRDELSTLGKHLPAEASEALAWLADGIPADEVREAVQASAAKAVDPADLAKALEHPDTKRRFVAIRSDADTLPKIIAELVSFRSSERANRVIDHDQDGSMEIKKREGYF